MDDLVQVMRDDTNLVPLYHVLAAAAAPTTKDAQGNTHRGVVDATTALLSRISGRAYDGERARPRSAPTSSIRTASCPSRSPTSSRR